MDKCVRVIQDGQPLSAMQQIEKNNKEDKMSYRVTGITLVGGLPSIQASHECDTVDQVMLEWWHMINPWLACSRLVRMVRRQKLT